MARPKKKVAQAEVLEGVLVDDAVTVMHHPFHPLQHVRIRTALRMGGLRLGKLNEVNRLLAQPELDCLLCCAICEMMEADLGYQGLFGLAILEVFEWILQHRDEIIAFIERLIELFL